MSIERMNADELANFFHASGTRVIRRAGTWWVEYHRFFFRPLQPLHELPIRSGTYPRLSLLGGIQHSVPPNAPANSSKRYFVFEHPREYDVSTLPHPRANKIRKGLKLFEWRRCTDEAVFIKTAYPVYAEFAHRTGYYFKRERLHRDGFSRWAHALFLHPKVLVYGAYHRNRLAAVSIFYLVDSVLVNGMYFSDTESQRLQVHDFVLHCLREETAKTNAELILMGPYTGVEGVDRAKFIRGCTLITKRTHLHLNPIAAAFLRYSRPDTYARLIGGVESDALPWLTPRPCATERVSEISENSIGRRDADAIP